MSYPEATTVAQLLDHAERVLIIQADNPDGDSLGSALALEQIVGDLGKQPWLYCAVDMPEHLHYLAGWDRVTRELPSHFDISLIVDTSAVSLLENLSLNGGLKLVRQKPCIVIDHHSSTEPLDFAAITLNYPAVATGEIIYELAKELAWPLNLSALTAVTVSILSDSLGLTSVATTPRSIHIIGELAEAGVELAKIENARRDTMRKSPELVRYKGLLLQRIEYHDDNRIATLTIPWEEIEKYSSSYNPAILALDDMRLTEGTQVAIVFKLYKDSKITAKVRCNYGVSIASDLAIAFGGGGHPYASGFKISDGRSFSNVKTATIAKASELLKAMNKKPVV